MQSQKGIFFFFFFLSHLFYFILFVVSLQQFVIRFFMLGEKKKEKKSERETCISAKSLVLLAAKGWILNWCKLEIVVLKASGLSWLTSWISFLLPAEAKAEAAGKSDEPVLVQTLACLRRCVKGELSRVQMCWIQEKSGPGKNRKEWRACGVKEGFWSLMVTKVWWRSEWRSRRVKWAIEGGNLSQQTTQKLIIEAEWRTGG